jgi:hypothetical protein
MLRLCPFHQVVKDLQTSCNKVVVKPMCTQCLLEQVVFTRTITVTDLPQVVPTGLIQLFVTGCYAHVVINFLTTLVNTCGRYENLVFGTNCCEPVVLINLVTR